MRESTQREQTRREPVIMPDLGCPRPRLSVWYAAIGEMVYAGDRLIEILVDGATVDLVAPAAGLLTTRLADVDELLEVGQVLAEIETTCL